jgi:predicted enzyme related to lactoylglutathione lyase
MSNPVGHFVWHELLTTDVAAAKQFYGHVVGWQYEDVPMPGMTYSILKTGDTQVGGMMTMPKELCDMSVKPHWGGYISSDDVDADAARVSKLGGSVHRLPTDIPNVGRFAVVADPLGATFCLFKWNATGTPEGGRKLGRVGWNELHSSDWPKAWEFYSTLFGWQKQQAVDMGPMGTYQTFNAAGVTDGTGGMFNSPAAAQVRACFWMYYFTVDSIDAATERVTKHGGTIMHPAQQVPGGIWIVQASDPQGAVFALLGPKT